MIYTDGGCIGNPGTGGWGALVILDGKENCLSGSEKLTTNNRMELRAAIEALTFVSSLESSQATKVELHIDSQYVKKGITEWIMNWKANGWKTAGKKDVKNQDLWRKLDELNGKLGVEWHWVKGHSGDKYNEMCDKMCKDEMLKAQ